MTGAAMTGVATAGVAKTGVELRPLVFLDLDDTVFQTRRKNADAAVVGAVDRHGAPLSFMTPGQVALVNWLQATTQVVPTTGRSTEALDRVQVPFRHGAICSFGGVIRRPDGTPDPAWHTRLADLAAAAAPDLFAIAEAVAARAAATNLDIRHRVIVDADLPLYLSVKHNQYDAAALAPLAPWLRGLLADGWRVHLNGNNLAVMPPFLDKAHAVRWFRDHIAGPHPFALGLGDSLSDRDYLLACDIAAVPAASQLATRLTGV